MRCRSAMATGVSAAPGIPADPTPAGAAASPDPTAGTVTVASTVTAHGAVFARMGRNIAWLLGGRGFSGAVSTLYLAVAARALGPHGFGLFTLVLAYGQAIANFVQFQSWQGVIRYGAAHLAAGRTDRLRRLLGFTATLDLGSALLGAVLAVAGVAVVAPWLGWNHAEQVRAGLFGAALLLSTGATPNGMMRLSDRFDLITYTEAVGPAVRLGGAVIAWLLGYGIDGFLVVWAAAALIETAGDWLIATIVVRMRIEVGRAAFAQAVAENPRIWRFMLLVNASMSLSMLWTQLGVLAVGGAAGASAAGGFRLASKLAKALAKPVQQIARVLYPELARLIASEDHATLVRVVRRVSWIAAALGLLIVAITGLGGTIVIDLIAGKAFRFAQPFLFLLGVAAAIDLSGFAFEPLLNAHGRAGRVLVTRAIGAVAYVALLAALLPRIGPEGAALAAIGASVAMRIRLQLLVGRLLRRGPRGVTAPVA